jgi:LDH2 family malate/lactate/ureidoglycolate dehydrogenase
MDDNNGRDGVRIYPANFYLIERPMDTRFSPERLERFIEAVLTTQGVLPEHAQITSKRMIEGDLRGVHSHGIFRLRQYSRRIQGGGYNLRPQIRSLRESPVSALLDGDNALGQVVVTRAAELAIEKAEKSGLAWVGIRRSNHSGCAGVYTALALKHDLISMYQIVGNANHMPPWGGVDLLLSTNPIAFAIPAGEEPPFSLDISTSMTSFGKVRVHQQTGKEMPVGWLVDRQGNPLTDPQKAEEGFLLPIGDHKGYGLNMVIGMLAGVLNGAAFGNDIVNISEDFKTATNSGQAFFAMRPDLFRDLGEFKAGMDNSIREIRNSTPLDGKCPIRIPGEGAIRKEQEMRENGIPVSAPTLKQLREFAQTLGLEDNLDA